MTPAERHRANMRRLGERLREARLDAGLSLARASERSGVSQGMISQSEIGRRTPTLRTLWKLAPCYGVTLASLIAPSEDQTLAVTLTEAEAAILRALALRIKDL